MMMLRSGIGAYPSDPYYDPDRPSWLPYWIDTPTESAIKWGMYPGVTTVEDVPSPPRPAAPSVPSGTGPGAVEEVVSSTSRAQREQLRQFYSQLAEEEEERQRKRDSEATTRTVLLVAGAGLAVYLVLRR